MKRVLIVMDEIVKLLVGRKTPDAESVLGVDIPLGVASGSLVWNLGATPHVTVCGALGKGVGFLDIIEGNGEGEDSPWSFAEGGHTVGGSAPGAMSAEVEIAYSGKSAEGANEFAVRAIGRHGSVHRTFSATIEHPGEGRE